MVVINYFQDFGISAPPNCHFPYSAARVPSIFLKNPNVRGSQNDPKIGHLWKAKKLQNPLNSLLFRARGLPKRGPFWEPLLVPGLHFLKEIIN